MAKESLVKAQKNKADEFYTMYETIEDELINYTRGYFYNKVVYCNCSNPYYSNFFKYFLVNFNTLHLKKIIASNKALHSTKAYKAYN